MAVIPPEEIHPGDVLITNDPWMSAGHFFRHHRTHADLPGRCADRLLRLHHPPTPIFGGYGIGAGARDIHEEGLWIPVLKLYEHGEPNAVLHKIIEHNVRTPDAIFGDLAAQRSSGKMGAQRLKRPCATATGSRTSGNWPTKSQGRFGRGDPWPISASCRPEPCAGETAFDVPGGDVITLKTAVTIDNGRGEILIDFEGSSPPSPHGINVVPAYTHAYSTFAVRSVLNPDLPNNAGQPGRRSG